MDKQIIVSNNDINIYGTLTIGKKKDSLIILVHGLSGNQNVHLVFNSAKLFSKEGYNVFRFDLYSGRKKGRKLEESTISNHASDIDKVIDTFKQEYSKIYLIGISLGGTAVLKAKNKIDTAKIILWDPSLDLKKIGNRYTFNKDMQMYYKWNSKLKFVGEDMFQEWRQIDTLKLLGELNISTKIFLAGKSIWSKYAPKINKIINMKIECEIINGASHSFDEFDTEEILLQKSLDFLNQ